MIIPVLPWMPLRARTQKLKGIQDHFRSLCSTQTIVSGAVMDYTVRSLWDAQTGKEPTWESWKGIHTVSSVSLVSGRQTLVLSGDNNYLAGCRYGQRTKKVEFNFILVVKASSATGERFSSLAGCILAYNTFEENSSLHSPLLDIVQPRTPPQSPQSTTPLTIIVKEHIQVQQEPAWFVQKVVNLEGI
jgi:hypothetical protein